MVSDFASNTMLIATIILLLLPSFAFGEVDTFAVKTADTFLKGIKLINLAEGKRMIAETAWLSDESYPVYTEISTLFEGMFQTNVPNIIGYKRLMEVKAVSKTGTPLLKQYLLISYKDKTTNQWKIFAFRESADTEYEAQAFCRDVDTPTIIRGRIFTPVKFKYRQCGYWSTLAGKLTQAKAAFLKASELNQLRTDDNVAPQSDYADVLNKIPQSDFDKYIDVLNKILGK